MVVLLCLYFYPIPALQILVYTISAQVVRLTTLPIDFSITLPTKWYITALVPRGVQRNLFLRVSPKGLYMILFKPNFDSLVLVT